MKQTKTKKGKVADAPAPDPQQDIPDPRASYANSLHDLAMASVEDEAEANKVASQAGARFAEAETKAEWELYETGQVYRPFVSLAAVSVRRNIELIRKEDMLPVCRTRLMRCLHRLQCLAAMYLPEAIEETFSRKDGRENQFGCMELQRQLEVLENVLQHMKSYHYIVSNIENDDN